MAQASFSWPAANSPSALIGPPHRTLRVDGYIDPYGKPIDPYGKSIGSGVGGDVLVWVQGLRAKMVSCGKQKEEEACTSRPPL